MDAEAVLKSDALREFVEDELSLITTLMGARNVLTGVKWNKLKTSVSVSQEAKVELSQVDLALMMTVCGEFDGVYTLIEDITGESLEVVQSKWEDDEKRREEYRMVVSMTPSELDTYIENEYFSGGFANKDAVNVPVKDKRGRKTDKIKQAFNSIPTTPTPVEEYANTHGVSIHVLRQGTRFDTEGKGKVIVKKLPRHSKEKTLMIWREAG